MSGLDYGWTGYPVLDKKSRIIRHIRQGMPDNSAGYPESGKKNQIRLNPNLDPDDHAVSDPEPCGVHLVIEGQGLFKMYRYTVLWGGEHFFNLWS